MTMHSKSKTRVTKIIIFKGFCYCYRTPILNPVCDSAANILFCFKKYEPNVGFIEHAFHVKFAKFFALYCTKREMDSFENVVGWVKHHQKPQSFCLHETATILAPGCLSKESLRKFLQLLNLRKLKNDLLEESA